MELEPVRGVRGASLAADDPVRGEWDLVVLSPHFAAALLARDLSDVGLDRERTFEFALTYDRDTVVRDPGPAREGRATDCPAGWTSRPACGEGRVGLRRYADRPARPASVVDALTVR